MEHRSFGNTDLKVSAISLGCWIFGVDWWGHYTDEQAVKLCQFAYDQGVTFFDGRRCLRHGRAETILGKFMETVPGDAVQVGKFGYDFYSDPERRES